MLGVEGLLAEIPSGTSDDCPFLGLRFSLAPGFTNFERIAPFPLIELRGADALGAPNEGVATGNKTNLGTAGANDRS